VVMTKCHFWVKKCDYRVHEDALNIGEERGKWDVHPAAIPVILILVLVAIVEPQVAACPSRASPTRDPIIDHQTRDRRAARSVYVSYVVGRINYALVYNQLAPNKRK
jgi:hypothetical protein